MAFLFEAGVAFTGVDYGLFQQCLGKFWFCYEFPPYGVVGDEPGGFPIGWPPITRGPVVFVLGVAVLLFGQFWGIGEDVEIPVGLFREYDGGTVLDRVFVGFQRSDELVELGVLS